MTRTQLLLTDSITLYQLHKQDYPLQDFGSSTSEDLTLTTLTSLHFYTMAARPNWMLKADVNAQADMQQKIAAKNEGHQQGSAKKQKPTRHIRARAKIGADGDNYTLPPWIDQENFKTMVLMILKSVSNSQQRLRILESVIADNFMVPSDLAAVAAAGAQAEAYHKKSISNSGEDLGAPGPQILYAFCEELRKADVGMDPKRTLKEHILDRIAATTQQKATELAAAFTIKPAHDPSFHKVILVSQDPLVRSTLTQALKAITGVKHFTAPAPASGQEDEIQKWIEKLESM